ncbi:hypothetical protein OEZ60_11580 [Defluviimonas sp. WL0024]|uniref:Uncharacterized protein n=1 Tax=Albidovulum salinarum TaxID=2984153 RepID=A0ABT2X4S9_9RHOB|nr:hypothetical protein [Defluviimonas sp. WL0024]MCU9848645.1 hypothetical protein [Defluviimonas sp. WL0024]
MKTTILAAAIVLAGSGAAFAAQCPSIMAQIDEALAASTADDATKAEVMALYETGKAAHEAGDHDASVADLNAALVLLGG